MNGSEMHLYEPNSASKVDNLEYCLRNLIALDIDSIDTLEQLKNASEVNVQFFINRIFALEKSSDSDGVYVKLPVKPVFQLPRVNPLPKPKPKTRWQIFAESKGIKKQKRSRLVWDESIKDWVPRWGHKSIKKGMTANPPIYEIKDSQDEYTNMFDIESKKKRLARLKNKFRELRNKIEASGDRINTTNDNDIINPAGPELLQGTKAKNGKSAILKKLSLSQKSDRSAGKHSNKIKGENVIRSRAMGKPKMLSLQSESTGYGKIISKVLAQQA